MRGVLAPMYRSARWYTDNGYLVKYEWDEAAGRKAMETRDRHRRGRAAASERAPLRHGASRRRSTPARPSLFRDSYAEAQRLQGPVPDPCRAIDRRVPRDHAPPRHDADRVARQHSACSGRPRSSGTASSSTITARRSWPKRDDLAHAHRDAARRSRIARPCSSAAASRCRRVGGYIRRGVKIGIGTDTYPHNMLEEMRHALYASRIVGKNVFDLRTSDIFNAATLGGAEALRRDDIGRLARRRQGRPGAGRRHRARRCGRCAIRSEPDLCGGGPRGAPRLRRRRSRSSTDGRVTTMDYATASPSSRRRSGASSRWCGSSTGRIARTRELSPLVYRRDD